MLAVSLFNWRCQVARDRTQYNLGCGRQPADHFKGMRLVIAKHICDPLRENESDVAQCIIIIILIFFSTL